MARPKSSLKQTKSKSKPKNEPKLDTADDFQSAGVDFEEAAGKWRAGDAAKSMRFFQRAIDVYDRGLQKFPRNADLAYNKARVQLEIATHPILVDQLQHPLKDVLEEALASHRYSLQLDQENADALFNTSQVLTTIAEVIASVDDDEEDSKSEAEALKLLREALELQSGCLNIQERKYHEFLEQERTADDQEGETNNPAPASDLAENPASDDVDNDGEWFNVVEPVTKDTLIDTLLAQLGTLTTFCSILSSSPDAAPANTLPWVEEFSAGLLGKMQGISHDQHERLQEIALAKANLVSAMLEAGYRSGKIDAETYKRERDSAFSATELQLERSIEGLLSNARSLLALYSALTEAENGDAQSQSTLRWNVLTASIANLKSASAIQGISQEDLVNTHVLRGDASLYLCAMAFPPTSYQTAANTATQNAKNAEVYYRNASKLTQDQEEKDVSSMKSIVAQYMQAYSQGQAHGDIGDLLNASPRDPEWAIGQIEDMAAENLVPPGVFS
ncbi:hypothetical protein F4805DRAFT_266801 [Annulohypoxylon moriforme]|nr:hypothetical protein F4805DRAFT_266801 [Annulohypoxylon moriforme]